MNFPKTEYMCVGRLQQDLKLENGKIMRYCQTYKYLGTNISHNGTANYAFRDRNTQDRKAIAMLNDILWDQKI